ncbi:alpha/beta fold hydrolase [Polluticaenibacter yanchengensis]|uniref:Alpha/beta hydrolase n=1 Tax=Polluticaenibacter yanchengensis TaxID=3014562 RepID=A0ABT4UL37_9BACT|nr:alpha/beta hydrolase [Chitinophagaceae bacterium LY-5]
MSNKLIALFILLSGIFCKTFAQTSQPVYDTLQIGGIKQVVSYKGSPDSAIILFLHGGPGSSRMRQADLFSNELEKHFLVVQWDQREAGRTAALNKSPLPITIERMENDSYELIVALLQKFNAKKLFLAGESWGNVPGFKMAEKHPELLHAYLAFSPVIDQAKSERILIEKLKASMKGNPVAQKELASIKVPFENSEQIYYSRKWMFHYDGNPFADKDTAAVKQYLQNWSDIWLPTWNKAIQRNLFKTLPKINCPVYFFIGNKDLQTNHEIATSYFQKLQAPHKKIYAFRNAGHSVLTEESAQVQKIIIEEILSRLK